MRQLAVLHPTGWLILLAALVGGCVFGRMPAPVVYSFSPVGDAAARLGAVRGEAHAQGRDQVVEIQLPSGEVVRGDAREVDRDAFEFGGVYSESIGAHAPTSLDPNIYQYFAKQLRPDADSIAMVVNGVGDRGTRVECEGFWNKQHEKGRGGCRFSGGALYSYRAIGVAAP